MIRDLKIKREYKTAGLAYFCSVTFFLLFSLALKHYVAAATKDGSELSEMGIDAFYTTILQLGIFIVGVFMLFKFVGKKEGREILSDAGVCKPKWWMIVFPFIMGVFVPFATMGFSAAWQTILAVMGYSASTRGSMELLTLNQFFAAILLTGIMPALGEEFMFRGVGLKALKKYGGFWWAVVISSLMFGFGHVFIEQTFYTMLMGVLTAYMALKFENILPAVIVHFMNNSIAVVMSYLSSKKGSIVYKLYDWLNQTLIEQNYAMLFVYLIVSFIVWLISVFVIVFLVSVMKKRRLNELCAERNQPTDESVQQGLEQLRKNSAEGAGTISSYPIKFVCFENNKPKISFNWADNAMLAGGLIMALFGTVATFIGGLIP